MRYRCMLLVGLFLSTLLFSCQGLKQTAHDQVERERTFNAHVDRTRRVVLKILSDDVYMLRTNDESTGVIETHNIGLDAEHAYEYSTRENSPGLRYQVGSINLKFLIQQLNDSSTVVQIFPHMQATFVFTDGHYDIQLLESDGTLEKSLFQRIENGLR